MPDVVLETWEEELEPASTVKQDVMLEGSCTLTATAD